MSNSNGHSEGHTITALVLDRPGVLNRISSMFRRRGFNIASLAVGQSEIPNQSRMTFVVDTDQADVVEQVTKQLRKVAEVVKVKASTAAVRGEIIQVVELFRARIVDIASDSVIIEVTGDNDKIGSLLTLLKGYGIVEVMRTGRIAMVRGKKAPLKVNERAKRGASKRT